MAWPPKIATAKPHERPKPFYMWYFSASARAVPDLPMIIELRCTVCGNDSERLDLVNYHLEAAFEAGRKSK